MPKVKLSSSEVRIASYIGKQRNMLSSQSKPNARRDPNQNDEEMNIQATAAELAVAKYLNVYPDLSPRAGELPQFDLHMNHQLLEVKRNHLLDGDLLVPKLRQDVIYILACGEMPEFSIIGWMTGARVPECGEWALLLYGPCWRVRPCHLKAMEHINV